MTDNHNVGHIIQLITSHPILSKDYQNELRIQLRPLGNKFIYLMMNIYLIILISLSPILISGISDVLGPKNLVY